MNQNSEKKEKSRLPPGQHVTDRFPVLQKGRIPTIDRENFILELEGELENPMRFKLKDLNQIQDKEIVADIHCVTSWSKYDTKWGGISFNKIFDLVKPKTTANYVEFLCADEGFTTTVPLEKLHAENTILALTYEGESISEKHGGPVRPIIPNLYFYKSAKWVLRISFLKEDRLGYWERGGYSNKADPWKQQRYSSQD
ncbi:MAG: molybdopterin-dependent oxidoreductase [Promethearchaeota archaeon]|jgi:DMSO/TMAO reductase YedYZ molybdopterin-dependent catalytic subunit